jgi:hypothetical protein
MFSISILGLGLFSLGFGEHVFYFVSIHLIVAMTPTYLAEVRALLSNLALFID